MFIFVDINRKYEMGMQLDPHLFIRNVINIYLLLLIVELVKVSGVLIYFLLVSFL